MHALIRKLARCNLLSFSEMMDVLGNFRKNVYYKLGIKINLFETSVTKKLVNISKIVLLYFSTMIVLLVV